MIDHLAVVTTEAGRVADLVRGATLAELAAPVVACPGWTAYDVVVHLGGVHRWATTATRTPPDGEVIDSTDPEGLGAAELAGWFAEGAADLATALAVDAATPCWTLAAPQTVGFWRRRQAHETTIHRWDLETALGLPAGIDPAVARDGVDEVVGVMLPRQVRLGRLVSSPDWVRLVVDGTEHTVASGERAERASEPLATVTGPAPDVLLLLWGRATLGALEVEGDRDRAAAHLGGPLTP